MHNYNFMISIFLVDDHVLLRNALASVIDEFGDCKVTAMAANGVELQEIMREKPYPDLVILDLNMPVMDGYDAAFWLFEHYPDIRVLILTMYDSEIALLRLLKLGVRGFLRKDMHPFELRSAIDTIMKEGYYYSHQTTGKLAGIFQKSLHDKQFMEKLMLTPTDIDFLKLASTDLTYKEIADQMKVSPRAIDGYRDSLFDRLQVKSRVGLAIFALKNGLITS